VRLPPAARSPAACAPQAAARVKRTAIEGERAARSGRRERRVVYRVRIAAAEELEQRGCVCLSPGVCSHRTVNNQQQHSQHPKPGYSTTA
jgi:hypothetical protein